MRERFKFALKEVKPTEHWRAFEELATSVLAIDFPNLRSMASVSGDRGRDAEIHFDEDEPSVLVQISTSEDYKSKIRQTVKRIKETMPATKWLVYVTHKEIGANADDLRNDLRRKHQLVLDVRDGNWFIERESDDPVWSNAVDQFCSVVADPILQERQIARKPQNLSKANAQIALLQLAFEEHDQTGKNLTKACFESLVFAALDGTSADKQISYEEIVRRVKNWVPDAPGIVVDDQELVDEFLDNKIKEAISRLTKKKQGQRRIVNHGQTKQYHIPYQEQKRRNGEAAKVALEQDRLRESFAGISFIKALDEKAKSAAIEFLESVTSRVLLQLGEEFAASVHGEVANSLNIEYIDELQTMSGKPSQLTWEQVKSAIYEILSSRDTLIQSYLRRLSNSYTFAAFLRRADDVQKTMRKVSSDSHIWLDTNILLPLFIEWICEEREDGRYTRLVKAAVSMGAKLYVTQGVIEEAYSHVAMSIQCARTWGQGWSGRTPYLLKEYVERAFPKNEFAAACEALCGAVRPEDDILSFLKEVHKIECKDLQVERDSAPDELKNLAEIFWYDTHNSRRGKRRQDGAGNRAHTLAEHDIENALGVMQRRNAERGSHLGYTSWWLTADSSAFEFVKYVRESDAKRLASVSPIMSLEFFSQYLRLSHSLTVKSENVPNIDVFYSQLGKYDVPDDIIEVADKIRAEYLDLPEHVIRRRVRDGLDAWRAGLLTS